MRTTTSLVVPCLLGCLLVGCSGSSDTGGGAGTGGGGAGGGGEGGAGGSAACAIGSTDSTTWTFTSPGIESLPLTNLETHTGDAPVAVELDGTVLASDPGTLEIDSCSPEADCLPTITTFTFAAEGLSVEPVPAGALVHLSFWSAVGTNTHSLYYTSLHLRVDNLPQWENMTNTVATSSHVWLAVHEHTVAGGPNSLTAETDPFKVEKAVACTDELTNLVYTLAFSFNGTSAATMPLSAGQEVELDVAGGAAAGHYTIHNLRSFDYIEPTAETAYWMTGTPML